jgi:hypothetical protein
MMREVEPSVVDEDRCGGEIGAFFLVASTRLRWNDKAILNELDNIAALSDYALLCSMALFSSSQSRSYCSL